MKIREMIESSKKIVMEDIREEVNVEMENALKEGISYLEISLKNVIDSELDEGIENLLLQKFLEDFELRIRYRLNEKKFLL